MNVKKLKKYLSTYHTESGEKDNELLLKQLNSIESADSIWVKLSHSYPLVITCILCAVGVVYCILFGFWTSAFMLFMLSVASIFLEPEIDRLAGYSEDVISKYNQCRIDYIRSFFRKTKRWIRVNQKKVSTDNDKRVITKKTIQNIVFILVLLIVVTLILFSCNSHY